MEMLCELVLGRARLDAVQDGSSWGLPPAHLAEPPKAASPRVASIPIELSEQELPTSVLPGGTKHGPCLRQHSPVPPSSISASWRWHLGVFGAGDHGWVPGWAQLGQGQSSDLRGMCASITQHLLSSPSRGQTQSPCGSAILLGFWDSLGRKHRLRQDLGLGPRRWRKEAGEFQGGNKSQLLLKKDISCRSGCAGEGKGRCVVTAGRASAGTGSGAAQYRHRGSGRPPALARLGTQGHGGEGWRDMVLTGAAGGAPGLYTPRTARARQSQRASTKPAAPTSKPAPSPAPTTRRAGGLAPGAWGSAEPGIAPL